MSKSEQPHEPEESPHQRDKTAKEPEVGLDSEPKSKPKPKPKVQVIKVYGKKKLFTFYQS